jgi:hypothetical protein
MSVPHRVEPTWLSVHYDARGGGGLLEIVLDTVLNVAGVNYHYLR